MQNIIKDIISTVDLFNFDMQSMQSQLNCEMARLAQEIQDKKLFEKARANILYYFNSKGINLK